MSWASGIGFLPVLLEFVSILCIEHLCLNKRSTNGVPKPRRERGREGGREGERERRGERAGEGEGEGEGCSKVSRPKEGLKEIAKDPRKKASPTS